MNRPSIDAILSVMESKDYRIYDTPSVDWNLNIVGIRANSRMPIEFDDLLVVFHRFMSHWDASYYPVTTDPSPYYLENPVNRKGAAILEPGQYNGVYKLDIHKRGRPGGHKALCQRNGNVSVFRDDNVNDILDMDPMTIESGSFGINIHRGPRGGAWEPKNTRYSAGCQVFADDRHFAEFMLKCEQGEQAFGNSFTYTLLLETDFE